MNDTRVFPRFFYKVLSLAATTTSFNLHHYPFIHPPLIGGITATSSPGERTTAPLLLLLLLSPSR
jgi:hypothetical protein